MFVFVEREACSCIVETSVAVIRGRVRESYFNDFTNPVSMWQIRS